MTTKVTFTEFRNDLSTYLSLMINEGRKVEITDGRTGKTLLKIIKDDEPDLDWDSHLQKLEGMKPFITDKDVKGMKKAREDINKRLAKGVI
ncbi:hypothetical protein A2188_01390 [Candidatus Woesebacteria bacterium RIFOXYA1_FULL_43_9]|uniref:Uncharacterized protein n=1 Tax=Candidatus Woesebacteria bacterium RIFOXYA1_FULL_43_9 TaxID=1802534 RepID=A0A1F8CP70_9BACT|nr:MAG: hypothetical protein A2188_01390 [Candidatus Woesebacteria bacterium RIFOXYA1_FULL_43_9]